MPKTDGGTMYTQMLTDPQLKTGNRSKKTEVTGRSSLKSKGPQWTVVSSKKKK
jgi:hypothetical protein